jgi:hypothetical protein
MPYIATTKRSNTETCECDPMDEGWCGRETMRTVSRRAVATLEEARAHAHSAASERGWSTRQNHDDIEALPDSGGTVTLPDGASIEVRQVGWGYIAAEAGQSNPQVTYVNGTRLNDAEKRFLLDAFNTRESTR